MRPVCPSCHSTNTRPSRNPTWFETFAELFGVYAVRCRECGERFRAGHLANRRYAQCPKCNRQDLSDWAEPYRYPRGISRLLVYLGARQHRCSPCRHNFVSFRPRQAEYVPSWKQTAPAPGAPPQPALTEVKVHD